MTSPEILRYSAFTTDPAGGNPAGVVLDATGLADEEMQRIAAEVGYSETAFLLPSDGDGTGIRYFSPLAEVTFCGHATIAAAVAHAERHGPGLLALHTQSGLVRVTIDAELAATLTSVAPEVVPLPEGDLTTILAALRWERDELDPGLRPAIAYAGAWHPVIVAATRERLADLDYDFDALGVLMAERGWTTISLVWREDDDAFRVRNPFPPGGVVEDPATGAAAAALGAFLDARSALPASRRIGIRQGEELGRPSRLTVEVPADVAEGVRVTGHAVAITAPAG